jgi:DNA-binding NarL/FixJ family response regulator
MIRLLIVDDHSVVRAGLRQILSETGDIVVAAEAGDGPTAIEQLRDGAFDVVVLDISLPGRSGVEVLKRIKAEWPRLPVLILSTYPEEQYAVRLLRNGAGGYLTKESAPESLVQAVRKLAAGGRYISARVAELLASEVALGDGAERAARLSDREHEILRLLGAGRSVSDIARALSLSVKTVSTYRTRLLRKLGLRTNADLIRYALDRRLID